MYYAFHFYLSIVEKRSNDKTQTRDMTRMEQHRVVVVLNTDSKKEYLQDPHGDFADQGVALMKKNDPENYVSSYKIFNCLSGDFPTLQYLQNKEVIGIYITGSVYDSFSNEHQWIVDLRNLLTTILTNHELYPPIFGVCFGHQLIAKCLGVETKRNPKGGENGLTELVLDERVRAIFDNKKSLFISETHNDIVTGLPKGFTNIGSTPVCEFQGFYKQGKVMSFQGHPEFTDEILLKIFQHELKRGDFSEDQFNIYTKGFSDYSNDGEYIGSFIFKLFKGEI